MCKEIIINLYNEMGLLVHLLLKDDQESAEIVHSDILKVSISPFLLKFYRQGHFHISIKLILFQSGPLNYQYFRNSFKKSEILKFDLN